MEMFLLLIAVVIVIGIIAAVFDSKRKEERRKKLVETYGEDIGNMIAAGKICQGMTTYQVREAWGDPADRDEAVLKTKTKETWKYGRTGANRYAQRVLFENGHVVGWQGRK